MTFRKVNNRRAAIEKRREPGAHPLSKLSARNIETTDVANDDNTTILTTLCTFHSHIMCFLRHNKCVYKVVFTGGLRRRTSVTRLLSPVLLLKVFGVEWSRAAEQRHLTGRHLGVQRGVRVNEGLDQLRRRTHLVLHQEGQERRIRAGPTIAAPQSNLSVWRRWVRFQRQPHLLLFDVAGGNVDVDGVLVVHEAAHAGHGRVEQALLLVEGPLLLSVWQGAGVGQEVHVRHLEVAHACGATPHAGGQRVKGQGVCSFQAWLLFTWNVNLAFILQVCPSQVAVERHRPIALGILSDFLRVGQVFHSARRGESE